jgi:hypothetical protein
MYKYAYVEQKLRRMRGIGGGGGGGGVVPRVAMDTASYLIKMRCFFLPSVAAVSRNPVGNAFVTSPPPHPGTNELPDRDQQDAKKCQLGEITDTDTHTNRRLVPGMGAMGWGEKVGILLRNLCKQLIFRSPLFPP